MMHEEAMCNPWHRKTNRADFGLVVRIFEDLCGFVMGFFRRMGSESAVFNPKMTVPGRF
jgi:hypothetical protein